MPLIHVELQKPTRLLQAADTGFACIPWQSAWRERKETGSPLRAVRSGLPLLT